MCWSGPTVRARSGFVRNWQSCDRIGQSESSAAELYASDYFEQLYEWACVLIREGLAYVDDQSADEIRAQRGTLTEPGRNSPRRDRPAEESLEMFARMRAGEFGNGEQVLRAKIDMASPNLNLRDPVMYRILHAHHQRTGDAWCIYPLYDWAHGQGDSIEGVTGCVPDPGRRVPHHL